MPIADNPVDDSPVARRCSTPLSDVFFRRDTPRLAIDLLGKVLVRQAAGRWLAGRIVETEAYLDRDDSACHAARGIKPKNAAMFGPPGRAYVYPIHAKWCFNVVTRPEGTAAAVLIRAIEPLAGLGAMAALRQGAAELPVCQWGSGPGRLCQIMGIDFTFNRHVLTAGPNDRSESLWIAEDGYVIEPGGIGCSPRIGVTSAAELMLRWFVVDHPSVSGLKRWHRQYAPPNRRSS